MTARGDLVRLGLVVGLALWPSPGTAGSLGVGNFAEPPGLLALAFDPPVHLPAVVAYGQVTVPADVGAGPLVVRGLHPQTSPGEASCQVDGAVPQTLALFSNDAQGRLQCTLLRGARSAKALGGLAASAALRLVQLSSLAGTGRLALYRPGQAFVAPCQPLVASAPVGYPDSSPSFSVPAGTYDLAFVRRCQPGAVDVPAVLPAVVVSEGNSQSVLLVGSTTGAEPDTQLRLVLATEEP